MQGQSRRGGLQGGRRAGPGSGLGGDRRGVGGMTPGRGPGGVMVAGATPDPIGGVAIGGTTAGFAGQPPAGGGGGQSLQDLFAAQQPPAQGIATVPTVQQPFGPPTAPNTPFSQLMDTPYGMFGFPDYSGFTNPLDEDNKSAYDSNMSYFDAIKMNPTFSNMENFFDTVTNPQIETRFGTFGFDPFDPSNVELDTPVGQFQFNIDDEPSLQFNMPMGQQSSLVNPDTSGIMQMADASQATINQIQQMKAAGLDEDFAKDQFIGTEVTPEEVEGIYRGTITSPTGQYSII